MAILIRSILHLDEAAAELLSLARDAFGRSPGRGERAPTGAAVRGGSGAAYQGASTSTGPGGVRCAEQVAVGVALTAGEEFVSAIALVLDPHQTHRPRDHGAHPCGSCRQLLADLGEAAGREVTVYVADAALTAVAVTTSGELLPDVLAPMFRQLNVTTAS